MVENAKVSKLGKVQKSFVRLFREIRSELKKVIWLNRQQVINNTITVLVSSLIVGVIIWTADAILTKLLLLVIK